MADTKLRALESELGAAVHKLLADVRRLTDENAKLASEKAQLEARLERGGDGEASELLRLQRLTLKALQHKYRRLLLYTDDLQRQLKTGAITPS